MSSSYPSSQVETVPSSQKGLDEQKSKLVPTHRTMSGNHHYTEGSVTVGSRYTALCQGVRWQCLKKIQTLRSHESDAGDTALPSEDFPV